MRAIVGDWDIVMITLDTLRFDVAEMLWRQERTPNLARVLPETGWERRHTPGSFTYAAHCAFFAGFLPTPAEPGRHPRLFAAAFAGSETTVETTCVLREADIVTGLAREHGYHTICVGGVGFFNMQTALGATLPGLFDEAHWSPELGVTDPESTRHQFELAASRLDAVDGGRAFLFVNVSALHQPNYFYLPGAQHDSLASHAAALEYVDSQLPSLFGALRRRGGALVILCSDHGTAYGEDGFRGHRLAHPVVWTVPFAARLLHADDLSDA